MPCQHLPGGTGSRGERTFPPKKRMEEDPVPALTGLRVSYSPSRELCNEGFPSRTRTGCCVGFGHSSPSERVYRSRRRSPLAAIAQGHSRLLGTPRGHAAAFAYRWAKS